MPRFDVDAWWKERQKRMHDQRREELGAVCTTCGIDLLNLLEGTAWSESDCPSSVAIECPECGAVFVFYLEWEMHLTRATRAVHRGGAVIR